MENKSRHVFGLNGVTGMLIATVLLLSILGGLTYWGILAQQDVMDKPYTLKDPSSVSMYTTVEKADQVMSIEK